MSETGLARMGEDSNVDLTTTSEMAVSRQAQEVQAAMVIAKKFPRDELDAIRRIKQACKRTSLAEVACYEYPRGGTKIDGPSVHLARAMAKSWGNIDHGVIELDQNTEKGESQVMAYCWDLETNTRATKIFTVPHIRYSKKKGNAKLTDPRDIYEMIANQGARRERACILDVIPEDVKNIAVEECNKTLIGDNDMPIRERIEKMMTAFEEYDVCKADIEAKLMHSVDACTERDILKLGKIYNSLKDGFAKKADYFDGATEVIAKPVAKKKTTKKTAKKEEKVEDDVAEPTLEEIEQAEMSDDIPY